MTTIQIDYENHGEEFWTAAHSLDSRTWTEHLRPAVDALGKLAGQVDLYHDSDDEVETTATEDEIIAVASTLPGWDTGPSHARRPVLIDAAL